MRFEQRPALKLAKSPAEHSHPVKVVIGQLLCWNRKQSKDTAGLEDNGECVDSPLQDSFNSSKSLAAYESNGIGLSDDAPVKFANLIRHAERELDRLRASGRNRLHRGLTDQVDSNLIVLTNQVTQDGRGSGRMDRLP